MAQTPKRKREYMRKYRGAWRNRNIEKARKQEYAARLRREYNMTLAEYDALVDGQAGACAICFKPPVGKRLVVDHDHETGRIRGLLCTTCNAGLGLLGDTAAVVRSALRYLGEK